MNDVFEKKLSTIVKSALLFGILLCSSLRGEDSNERIYDKLYAISVGGEGDAQRCAELLAVVFGAEADLESFAAQPLPIFDKSVGVLASILALGLSEEELREALPLAEVKTVSVAYLDSTFAALGELEYLGLVERILEGSLRIDLNLEDTANSPSFEWLEANEPEKFQQLVGKWFSKAQASAVADTDGSEVRDLSDKRFATSVQLGYQYVDLGDDQANFPYVSFDFYNKGALSSKSVLMSQAKRVADGDSGGNFVRRDFGESKGFDRIDANVSFNFGGAEVEKLDQEADPSDPEEGDGSSDGEDTPSHFELIGAAETLSASLTLYSPFVVNDYKESIWTKEIGFVGKVQAEFLTGNFQFVDPEAEPGNDFRTSYSFGLRGAVWNNEDADHGGPDYFLDIMLLDAEDRSVDWEVDGRFRIFNSRFFGFANARFSGDGDDSIVYGFYTQASWDDMGQFFSGFARK